MNDHGLRFFQDYRPGATFELGQVGIDEASIIAFAKEFDPHDFHTDPVAATSGPFGGLVASGWHTAGATMRLYVENYLSPESSLGGAGIDELRWPHPVRPGDTLSVRVTVADARRSRTKPDRGIVRTLIEARNADGRIVMSGTAINIIRARPAAG